MKPMDHPFKGPTEGTTDGFCVDCGRPYQTRDERHEYGKVWRLVNGELEMHAYVNADYEREQAEEKQFYQMLPGAPVAAPAAEAVSADPGVAVPSVEELAKALANAHHGSSCHNTRTGILVRWEALSPNARERVRGDAYRVRQNLIKQLRGEA